MGHRPQEGDMPYRMAEMDQGHLVSPVCCEGIHAKEAAVERLSEPGQGSFGKASKRKSAGMGPQILNWTCIFSAILDSK